MNYYLILDSDFLILFVMPYTQEINHLIKADPILAIAIRRLGPCGLKPTHGEPFEELGESILYQQLSGKAAATITGRFKNLFGGQWPGAGALLATPNAKIRGVGISNAKMLALQDLAKHAQRGKLKMAALEKLADDALVEHVDKIRGIGRWTAEMFLIFTLGRPDIFPLDDLGIQKGLQKLFGYKKLPAKRTMLKHAAKWQPFRTIASWYLWRIADENK